MINQDEFYAFYLKELSGIIEPMENYRQENSKKLKSRLLTAIFLLPIVGLGTLTLQPLVIILSLLPSLLFFGLFYQKYQEMNAKLRYPYKYKVLLKAIEFFFEHHEYIVNQSISKKAFARSLLFPAYITLVKGEDFMKFKIGQVNIMFCEARVYGIYGIRLFNGLFLASSFNKYFKCKTIVFSRKPSNYYAIKKRKLFQKLRKIRLEDLEFESQFYTISNDQVEARYLLSTSLMKRILDYKEKTKKNFSIAFIDNTLYCAVPKYDDFFEVPFFKPIDFELVKKSLAPVMLYTDLVEDLNLNRRIWTRFSFDS